MFDLDRYTVRGGKIIGEDGKARNIVTMLNSIAQVPVEPVSDKVYTVESYQPINGRVLGEDGKAYNLVDLIQAIGVGGGSIEPGNLLRYKHEQTEPSSTWNIQHNLGQKYVNAKIVSSSGEEMISYVDYQSSTVNLLVVQFANQVTGSAFVFY